MQALTETIIYQMINSFDKTEVDPTREEKYLAFQVCKNIADLCDTARAIINILESRNKNDDNVVSKFPSHDSLAMYRRFLKSLYSEDMFILDSDGNECPSWSNVDKFDTYKSVTAYKLYKSIRDGTIDAKNIDKVKEALEQGDYKYFIDNYDEFIKNLPFDKWLDSFKNIINIDDARAGIILYKNFLNEDIVDRSHIDNIRDFFNILLDIFLDETECINDLKSTL